MSDYNKIIRRTAVLKRIHKNAIENEELHTEISEVGDGLAIIIKITKTFVWQIFIFMLYRNINLRLFIKWINLDDAKWLK